MPARRRLGRNIVVQVQRWHQSSHRTGPRERDCRGARAQVRRSVEHPGDALFRGSGVAIELEGAQTLLLLMLKLNDSYLTFGPSRVCRAHITEHRMARSDVDAILALKPERAIVAHGEILSAGATAAIERGYAWLR